MQARLLALACVGFVQIGSAGAMESCVGHYSAALLNALPVPTVVALDVPDSTPTNANLLQAFTRGMSEAGQATGSQPTVKLSLSYQVTGQGGGGGGSDGGSTTPGGTAGGWSNWSGSNAPWLQGGETAALPGIPSYDAFSPQPAAQSALLFLRAQLQPVGASTPAWIATLQCTMQAADNQQLAYQLGYLIGGAIGKRIDNSPL
ncbi:MAG TPA: hypothetical protein VFL55_10530 [Acetobacteraceae bacterium]|nr:hypothetical protein [Acetobacteraceae bacterium]